MDPDRTLVMLARNLVEGQRSLAGLRRQTKVSADQAADPNQTQKVAAEFAELEQQWHRATLPSMSPPLSWHWRYSTPFGPGQTRIDDPMDALS